MTGLSAKYQSPVPQIAGNLATDAAGGGYRSLLEIFKILGTLVCNISWSLDWRALSFSQRAIGGSFEAISEPLLE